MLPFLLPGGSLSRILLREKLSPVMATLAVIEDTNIDCFTS